MSGDSDYLTEIVTMLGRFAKDGQSIGEQTELVADLGLSSLQVMELVEQIEDRYDISVPLNALMQVRTVGDLGRQLDRLIGGPQ